jgi:hypothetical protein
MQGYNTAVVISGQSALNKLVYGPALCVGIDIGPGKPSSKGDLSVTLIFPIRNGEAQNYIHLLILKSEYGASFTNDLIHIGFSIGYKFILN